MILKIVVAVVVLLAAILLFAATKPDTFRIQRSLVIQAPPGKISPLINDFHNWPQWAPQDREDATMKRTFGGAESGVGATSDWSGIGQTGAGRMEIAASTPSKSVIVDVDWRRPFAALNINEFTLESRRDIDQSHVEHARPEPLHDEADERLHQHGPHDGPALRERPRESQTGRRASSPLLAAAAVRNDSYQGTTSVSA